MPSETDDRMAMMVLEDHVPPERWADLAYAAGNARGLPAQMVRTFLVQDAADPTPWRGISVWRSRAALVDYLR